jgi:4-hydroxy-3-polyprenylbenzoate decarboxylase
MTEGTIALGMTGASGIQYGLRLLQCLIEAGRHVQLMVSQPAQIVIAHETDLRPPGQPAEMQRFFAGLYGAAEGQIEVFGPNQWFAPPASGSSAPAAMVICPCTSGTLAAVASGISDNLLHRAADVVLKEQHKLIVVPREMPFSAIHLENMLKLARLGAVIMPPSPGFYHRPRSIEDLVDFVVARIMDHLGIPQTLTPRWGEPGE